MSQKAGERATRNARLAGEDLADDFLDGDFLDVDVGDGYFVEEFLADGDDLFALDFELDAVGAVLDQLAAAAEIHGGETGPGLPGQMVTNFESRKNGQ